MKIFRFLKMRMVVLAACTGMILSGSALAADQAPESPSLKDPPAIELQKCIQVQQDVGRNPLSPMPNEFLMVTKYIEKSDETGVMKEGLKPGRAFNMYLVLSFLVPPENQEIAVAHSMGLIVKVITTDAESSRETIRQWVLIDADGDRNVDSATFRETITGEGKEPISSNEVMFPVNRLRELQTYYEKAVLTLGSKAEKGDEEGCMIS